jgi:MFS superfamily sulfate permease-like transporter
MSHKIGLAAIWASGVPLPARAGIVLFAALFVLATLNNEYYPLVPSMSVGLPAFPHLTWCLDKRQTLTVCAVQFVVCFHCLITSYFFQSCEPDGHFHTGL